jgi:quinol monooxygenase YgiN
MGTIFRTRETPAEPTPGGRIPGSSCATRRRRAGGTVLGTRRQVDPSGAFMAIIVRGELRALAGKREDFARLANALADAARDEPGTLRYEWYTSDDPDDFVVIEEYADPEAALAHNRHCAELLQRVPALATVDSVHLHGALGPDLQAWIAGIPVAHGHPPLGPA